MSRRKRIELPKQNNFSIVVPNGTEKITLNKNVIKDLLQKYCNQPIVDYHIMDDDGLHKFEIEFPILDK